MARTIVTGAAGFIGTSLCRHLVDAGHDVIALDRVPGARQVSNIRSLDGARVVQADLAAMDTAALRRLLDGAAAVVHLAGQPGVQTSWGQGFEAHLTGNVAISQRLLEATLDVGVDRVVMASSSSVYGSSDGTPLHEDRAPAPISPYGATKAAMELLASTYAARGVPTVCLRYFTVFGRRQRPDMAIHRILQAALGGPGFAVRGDGSQARDFTHVDDVVAATVAAIDRPLAAGTVLNVGSGDPHTLTAVMDRCAELIGTPIPASTVSAAPGDPQLTSADISRARRLLGWSPQVSLEEGLADQLRWLTGDHSDHPSALATAS